MDIRFSLARKLKKPLPKATGLTLRSVRFDAGSADACAILMASGYQKIREGAEDFRMRTGLPLSCRARGKSLEVVSEGGDDPLGTLMAFLSHLAFNSEDVSETLEFYARYLAKDAETSFRAVSMEMSSEDLRIACVAPLVDGEVPERLLSDVSSLLDRYDMGIIKADGSGELSPESE